MSLSPFSPYYGPMKQFSTAQKKDLKVLIDFVRIYCKDLHREQAEVTLSDDLALPSHQKISLCPDCLALLEYALLKRRNCPLDPKPSCKHCHIHCYSKDYRARMREIMAISGRKMIMRGRVDYLWHYLF
jgi:YbgA-like uncharacterized protein